MAQERTGTGLTVSSVARRLGVAPATLRTWDRRYGVGPSAHAAGAHRRYTAEDVRRLELMRGLVHQGLPPADAARLALDADAPAPQRSRRPGGRVLPLPDVEDHLRGLGRAAMSLDGHAVLTGIAEHLQRHGVEHTWEAVVVPLLTAVGERWAGTGEGVEVEHLVSGCVAAALHRTAPATPPPPRAALLACAPGDLHALPLHAVAAGLAERGIGSRLLGAAVPVDALAAAVRRTGPAAVFLWAQTPETADPGVPRALPGTRPAASVVLGGPGWSADVPGTSRVDSLGAALDALTRAHRGQALASSG